jgi:hypothetical protein
MAYNLGIDLGTTFTAAAVSRDGRAQMCALGFQGRGGPVGAAAPRRPDVPRRRGGRPPGAVPAGTRRPRVQAPDGRHHAQLAPPAGTLTVEDLRSTNGTFVAGRRVHRTTLHDGDTLQVGESSWRIVLAPLDDGG